MKIIFIVHKSIWDLKIDKITFQTGMYILYSSEICVAMGWKQNDLCPNTVHVHQNLSKSDWNFNFVWKFQILANIDEIWKKIYKFNIKVYFYFFIIDIYLLDLALHMQQPFADRKTFGLWKVNMVFCFRKLVPTQFNYVCLQ